MCVSVFLLIPKWGEGHRMHYTHFIKVYTVTVTTF